MVLGYLPLSFHSWCWEEQVVVWLTYSFPILSTRLSDVQAFFSGFTVVSIYDIFVSGDGGGSSSLHKAQLFARHRISQWGIGSIVPSSEVYGNDSLVPRVRSGFFLSISCDIGWRKLSAQFLCPCFSVPLLLRSMDGSQEEGASLWLWIRTFIIHLLQLGLCHPA